MNSVHNSGVSLVARWFDEAKPCIGSLSSIKEIRTALDKAPDELNAYDAPAEYRELGVCNGRNSLLMFSHDDRFEEPDARLMDLGDPSTPQEMCLWMIGFIEGFESVEREQHQQRNEMVA